MPTSVQCQLQHNFPEEETMAHSDRAMETTNNLGSMDHWSSQSIFKDHKITWVFKICEIKCQLGTAAATRIPKGLPAGYMPQAYAKSNAAKSNWKRNWLLPQLIHQQQVGSEASAQCLWGQKAPSSSLTMKQALQYLLLE